MYVGGRDQRKSPMDIRPPRCRCGEAQVARMSMADQFGNPDPAHAWCHFCRMFESANPDWTADQVAAAGRAKWQACQAEADRRKKDSE